MHVLRATAKFFGNETKLRLPSLKCFDHWSSIVENEKISLSMFKKTFNKIDFRNDFEVYKVLREKHPYYNGKVFSKI